MEEGVAKLGRDAGCLALSDRPRILRTAGILLACALPECAPPPLAAPARAATTASEAAALAPPMPRHRGDAMASRNDACEACHADIAAEWRGSLHRRSWVEPAFQRAYAREPLAFCRACHAPEAPDAAPPSPAAGALGVGCVTCHLEGDAVLASSVPNPVAGGRSAPHPVVRDGRLDGAVACAGCHEFAFPAGGAPLGSGAPMQSTISEHAASPAASRSCASCHMPAGAGHRMHRFAASRDAALVRAAVDVDARREGPTSVTVRLTSRAGGHAFPTGDLFRRVEILVEAISLGEVLEATETRYLARHFPQKPLVPGGPRARFFGPDDRLRQEPVVIVLDLGERARGRLVRFRVAYQRVGHPRSATEETSDVEGEIVLAEGSLPASGVDAPATTPAGSTP